MAIAANLSVALALNSARYRQGLDEARARTDRFRRNTEGTLSRLTRSFRGITSAAIGFGAALGLQQVLSTTDNLIKLSDAVGGNFEQFQRLSFALGQTGLSSDQVARALTTLSGLVIDLGDGSATAVRAFETLGLSFTDLEGRTPEEQFNAVLQALRDIEDTSLRAGTAADVFGNRLSVSLGPAIASSAADLQTLGDSISIITEADARMIEGFNDSITALGQAVSTLVTQFAPFFDQLASAAGFITRSIQAYDGLANVIGTVLVAVIANRFIPVFATLATAYRAFVATTRTVGARLSSNGNQLQIAAGRYTVLANNVAFSVARFTGLRTAIRLTNIAIVTATVSVRAFNVAVAALGGPIGILITAGITLASVFGDQLVNAFRAAVNFITRQINRLISGLDRLFQFFGADGISFRFEEWTASVQEASDAVDGMTGSVDAATSALLNLNDELSDDTISDRIEQLDEGFRSVGESIQTNLRDNIQDAFETGRFAVDDFFSAVSSSILQVASNRITNSILGSVFGGGGFGGNLGTVLGFQNGGVVPRTPGSRPGVDSVPALLTPGETVIPAGETPGGVTVNFNLTGDVGDATLRVIEENSLRISSIIEQQLEDRGRF